MKKIVLLCLSFLIVGFAFGQQPLQQLQKNDVNTIDNIQWHTGSKVIHCSNFGVTIPLRDMPQVEKSFLDNRIFPFTEWPDKRDMPVQLFVYSVANDGPKYGNDPSIIQTQQGKRAGKAPIQNWEAQNASGFRPDDPTGAVGPNHYMQAINGDTYEIWDKTGASLHTGTISALWAYAPGDGDPIILYDKDADRWFLSQFANGASGGDANNIYIAISQTPDPTGAWYTYTFSSPDFPDYLKFGAWHDGYYMTANYAEKIFAFNRTKMLAGDGSAEAVYQTFNPNQGGFFVPSAGDASDGTMPTSGPCPIFCYQDDAWGAWNDAINVYDAAVTWGATPNMTVTLATSINTSAFDASYDSGWDDVEQPGTTQMLDGIGGAMMFRTQWKTWSGYNTAVMNWAVQVTPTQRGIFWCELRQDQGTGNWTMYQQGIYAPGTDNVWIGSIAMNDAGGIGLAYAKTNKVGGVYMSLAYAGRLSCDPLGTLPITEVIAQAGTGYQTGANRVGDYAQTVLDPDGVTFWHTGEYLKADGSEGTRVYSFQLPGACAPPTNVSASPTSLFEDRGKQITVTGDDMGGCTFTIGGVVGTPISNDGSTAVISFPAGNYTGSTLTVENAMGSDTYGMTINTRNTIPVVSGAGVTSDNHPTILSAVTGLHAWYGTTAFNAGDLAGTKTINVYAGTYTDEVVLNSELNPTAANPLIIQNNTGDVVTVDASGNNYGFNLSTVDYVTLTGFTVETADLANIYLQGDNCEVYYNKVYDGAEAGIKIETGTTNNIHNNLCYTNKFGLQVTNSNSNTLKNNTLADNGGTTTPAMTTIFGPESFEGTFEPAGWSQYDETGDNSSHTWNKGTFSGVTAPDGSVYATISYHTNKKINRPLETPGIDLTGYSSAELQYYVFINWNYDEIMYVEISTTAGAGGTWTELTRHETSYGGFSPLQTVDISAYVGQTVYIRFRYYEWPDENSSAIDWVHVQGAAAAVTEGSGLYVESGTGTTVENNIISAKTGNNAYYALKSEPGITVSSDYNTYYSTNTNLFDYNGAQNNTGPMSGNDITTDPDFVNAGTDYHIKSTNDSYTGGSWPPLTAFGGGWNTDGSDSPALDAGNPADPFANEPAAGGRINQGAYGNTAQASKSLASCTPPGTQASAFSATPYETSVDLSWTKGNGNNVIVLAHEGSAVDANPVSGTSYTDNTVFGSGSEIGTGNFVVYDANSNSPSVTVTGLTANTTYYFAVYEYFTADDCYLTPGLLGDELTLPAQPSTITGSTTPCEGSSQVYSVTDVTGVTETWAFPAGWSITAGQGTNSVTVTVGANDGNVQVTPSNASGDGTARTLAVAVSNLPGASGVITGQATVCQGENGAGNYSVTAISDASSYTWSYSGTGATFSGSTNNITIDFSAVATSGNLTVMGTNACGNGTVSANYAITVNPLPTAPTSVSATPNPITAGNSTTLSYVGGSGTTFTWYTGSCGGTSVGTGQDLSVSPAVTTTYYGAWSNSCGESACQSVTVTVNAAAITWDGTIDSDWQTAGNWSSNAVPIITDDITILDVANDPIIDDVTVAVCNNMTINSGAIVTIAVDGELTVQGEITNNAGNAGLVIESDATGTGSLIHNSTLGVDATVNQYFSAAGRAWHMLGSPISGATVAVFPNTTYLFEYDESVDDYWTGSSYDSPVNGWTNYAAGGLTVAKGYLYNEFAQTLTFTGQLNTSISGNGISVDYTNNGGVAGNGSSYADFDGWNFISNPFTSAIDWTVANAGAANLYDAIYVWDDVAGTYKSFVVGTDSWNGAGTSGGSQFIASMQGFFVKGDATETAGTLDLPAGARVHNSVAFWKSNISKETPDNFLRLQVSSNNFQDELIVRFDEQATTDMDNGLDAYKLFSHYTHVPQIYTLGIDASTEYSINTLANIQDEETVTVPLKVYSNNVDFSIAASEFNFANTKVYLRDNNATGVVEVYELKSNTVLNFNPTSNDEVDRFELVFVGQPALDISEVASSDYNVSIYPNPSSGDFYLRVDDYKENYQVTILSVTGKLVYQSSFIGKDYQTIDLSSASSGIYFVSIVLNNKVTKYEKIVIK